jgi:hypothetical protein
MNKRDIAAENWDEFRKKVERRNIAKIAVEVYKIC